MILEKYEKQPIDVKDYDIDYRPWLSLMPGDTLDDVDATVQCLSDPADTALVIDSTQMTQESVKVWLSGGTDGQRYKVEVTVTTVGGRTDQSELIFKIKER